MPKKAIITIDLVEESSETPNSQIEQEIRTDTQIPWCTKINKIEIYSA
jgi:hypothetical protein